MTSGQGVCCGDRRTGVDGVEAKYALYVVDSGLVVRPVGEERLGGDYGCGVAMHD
jgi:hypothetical protein